MHIPVHSPWLPGYIHVAQTILVMLTMAGRFLDTPHIVVYNFWNDITMTSSPVEISFHEVHL